MNTAELQSQLDRIVQSLSGMSCAHNETPALTTAYGDLKWLKAHQHSSD